MDRFTSAIIVAAGDSTRMGYKLSKQLIPLNGHAAIEYTIKAFQSCALIDEIIVVARSKDIDDIAHIAFQFKKVSSVTAGGSTRVESVRKGIKAADKRVTHYAIHDGARVLITPAQIEKVLNAAYSSGAAALGTPVTDTVKVVDENGVIISTPDRSSMWAVQTPQVFEKELYRRAMKNALESGLNVTDDCSMVEAIGEKVRIVRGEYSNIKLTTPSDITVAEAFLAKRK
ncbi:MAG: 2-C-methyl-D-erythritol 4-phosphate cytidylyltransferase [Ruminococcus sp.]|nr:2-C-methyl-D-erythritol 4-phosphate cytidylyltransferase [Ruminococcus sp.]